MSSVPTSKQCEKVSSILKTLSHPQRLLILCELVESPLTVSDLEHRCQASQSQISQFLSRMKLENLVASSRDGHHVVYSIADSKILKLVQAMKRIYCRTD